MVFIMTALFPPPAKKRPLVSRDVPPLENGDQLTASEFLRRYDAMPEVKKAELIQGIVYMASPVRADQHGDPDSILQTWMGTYAAATRGTRASTNTTTRLGADEVPQPDGSLRLLPEYGGQVRMDKKGYLVGAPELVVEIAASSASVDSTAKLDTYRRAGVREYLLWRTVDECVDWLELIEDDYVHILPDASGVIRSHIFPGLWLDMNALLDLDAARVLAKLAEGLASEEHAAFIAKMAAVG